jgi:DNA-binding protein H-NS
MTLDELTVLVKLDTSAASPTPKEPKRPKYSDANGNTWSGRGKRPTWIMQALAEGKTLEDLVA